MSRRWPALVLLAGLLLPAVWADGERSRTLTVTGQGEVAVPVTEALLSLGVREEGATAQAAQGQLTQKVNRLVKTLTQAKVQDLQTTRVDLSPSYDKEGRTVVGFIASNQVRFKVPVAQAGTLLDQSVATGANAVDQVSFDISDQAREAARAEALKQAVADARRQAQVVLSTLDLTLKEIRSIQINSAIDRPPVPQYRAFGKEALANTPIDLQGGKTMVQAQVTLEVGY
ncbi:SIMPL domain-containing protein [Anthocerotibacter panamensis]|uniref:SIMPL domain-containing protein n=1 Tax=Anthocerotibacter panamensis TaxID=2857077 RepID=UPI001C408765|nr:SIMPL domain-containing protein [Anthocerotibacter panamensis]